MADVRIVQPSRNIMQSAPNAEGQWYVEHMSVSKKRVDPVMGWTSSQDVSEQLNMSFSSLDDAKQYCEKNGLSYVVVKPQVRKVNIHPYANTLMKNPNL